MRKKTKDNGLYQNLDTEENREYWRKAEETTRIVESWPEWKRNIQIGSVTKETHHDR